MLFKTKRKMDYQPKIIRDFVTFNSLPVYAKLEIFKFLDAVDLCRIATVSRDWLSLATDDVLWQKLLDRDCKTWHIICWDSNPLLYAPLQSDWSQKRIYLQCCPSIRKLQTHQTDLYTSLTNLLRLFLPKKIPRVAMFGPGLESSTSGIVGHILYDGNNQFTTIKMFPGLFGGLGSGFTLKMAAVTLDLMVLYSSTKKERTAAGRAQNRMGRSRLIRHDVDPEGGDCGRGYELTRSVSDLCHTLDAFVYVIDADPTEDGCSNDELMAMCNERWSSIHLPVVVLSCVKATGRPRRSCIDVANVLNVSLLNRPWQVHDVDVTSMSGVIESFSWLVELATTK